MYIVTFYSYKGGVGRSMAMVNTGVQLAQAGRRVLLVDFDLEAPGLTTFNLTKPSTAIPGVVDFVSKYIEDGEASDISSFIYESDRYPSGGQLWIMPAGLQDEGYSARLNSIDWPDLYSQKSGFLLFEDLKRQWDAHLQPDYVLIDSRTGHSDVEGICTRQLPDAVCLLFFPNDQNLDGLRKIVTNVRAEANGPRKKDIQLHFVVSNVPDLDDEDRILAGRMRRFKSELKYGELASEIHHYNSLALLNQEIFSLNHPNSRLTREYREVVKAVTRHNPSDRDAVLDFLKRAERRVESVTAEMTPTQFDERLNAILRIFSHDGEVCYRLALVRESLGDSEAALSLLTSNAVEKGYRTASVLARRAGLHQRLGQLDHAKADLDLMLQASGAELSDFFAAIRLMTDLEPTLLQKIADSKAFQSVSPKDRLFVIFELDGDTNQLRASQAIINHLKTLESQVEIPRGVLESRLAMGCIGLQQFDKALEIYESLKHDDDNLDIAIVFNEAMATWGKSKRRPIDMFKHIVELDKKNTPRFSSANYAECIAIAYAAIGDDVTANDLIHKAKNLVMAQPGREFSAWRYLRVPAKTFLEDLDEIKAFAEGAEIEPQFMRTEQT